MRPSTLKAAMMKQRLLHPGGSWGSARSGTRSTNFGRAKAYHGIQNLHSKDVSCVFLRREGRHSASGRYCGREVSQIVRNAGLNPNYFLQGRNLAWSHRDYAMFPVLMNAKKLLKALRGVPLKGIGNAIPD